jgi:hypothetical protein
VFFSWTNRGEVQDNLEGKRFDSYTTPTQQSHNNPSHDGRPHTLGPTLM